MFWECVTGGQPEEADVQTVAVRISECYWCQIRRGCFHRQDKLCKVLNPKKTWCMVGNEMPVELSLMSCLTQDDIRKVGLGEQLEEAFEGFN